MWDKVPKLEANGNGPHYIQEHNFSGIISDEIKNQINSKITPFYKLTYKEEINNNDNSTITYLISTID